jgi:hypothetical protein
MGSASRDICTRGSPRAARPGLEDAGPSVQIISARRLIFCCPPSPHAGSRQPAQPPHQHHHGQHVTTQQTAQSFSPMDAGKETIRERNSNHARRDLAVLPDGRGRGARQGQDRPGSVGKRPGPRRAPGRYRDRRGPARLRAEHGGRCQPGCRRWRGPRALPSPAAQSRLRGWPARRGGSLPGDAGGAGKPARRRWFRRRAAVARCAYRGPQRGFHPAHRPLRSDRHRRPDRAGHDGALPAR